MTITAVRAMSLALALVACAWFAIGVRQAHNTYRATALLAAPGPISHARVDGLLDAAKTLNPDRQVDLLRAQLALRDGDPAQARRIVNRVVAAEPKNLAAWLLLAKASVHDPVSFYYALIHVHALAPPVHRSP